MTEPRRFESNRLVVASHNAGKLREITELLSGYAIEVIGAAHCGVDAPDEDGDSYKANARIKALTAAQQTGIPALADDSGFEVMALSGAPGLYSARWAGDDQDFGAAMKKLREKMLASGNPDTRCRFICALSLGWADGHDETVSGYINGAFVWPPRGTMGFGYDPVFHPEGHDRSFGEFDPEEKHAISHRAMAFKLMVERCFAETPRR